MCNLTTFVSLFRFYQKSWDIKKTKVKLLELNKIVKLLWFNLSFNFFSCNRTTVQRKKSGRKDLQFALQLVCQV